MVRPHKAVFLRDQANTFQEALDRLAKWTSLHHYASAIRNTYNAIQEAPDWTKESFTLSQRLKQAARHILSYLTRRPYFQAKGPVTLLSIHPIVDDPVSRLADLPITKLEFKRHNRNPINVLINLLHLPKAMLAWVLLLSDRNLNRQAVFNSLPDLLEYTLVYNRIQLGKVRAIILQRDRYGGEVAIARRARSLGIPTIKADYYSPLDAFCQNTIEAEYFFYPNDNNRSIYERYPQNRHVKYVQGGLPKWDLIAGHKHKPQTDPKIVLFMGQYDMEAFTGVDERFYIDLIAKNLPADFQLWIKPHPSEQFERYTKYREIGARVWAHGEIDNYELIAQSTVCFSVYSAMLYEAKHICERSFVINFFPELAPQVEYEFLSQYVDRIGNESQLQDALNDRIKPIPTPLFISRFNRTFPNSSIELKNLAYRLLAEER